MGRISDIPDVPDLILPWPARLRTREYPASCAPQAVHDEFRRCCEAPGWNPKLVPLGGRLYCADTCAVAGGGALHSFDVIRLADYAPGIRFLEPFQHVPRIVRSMYRADVRLREFRMSSLPDDGFLYDRATEAWAKYLGVTDMRSADEFLERFPDYTVEFAHSRVVIERNPYL